MDQSDVNIYNFDHIPLKREENHTFVTALQRSCTAMYSKILVIKSFAPGTLEEKQTNYDFNHHARPLVCCHIIDGSIQTESQAISIHIPSG